VSRLLATGCTGLIGSHLVEALLATGHEVALCSRDPDAARRRLPADVGDRVAWQRWDGEREPVDPAWLRGVDAVVNLAGAGIADRRWSRARKQRLRESRVAPTRSVVAAMREVGTGVLIQASAIGYYGNRRDAVDERDEPGTGFLAALTRDWEAACAPLETTARVVRLRIGVVLSPRGGALAKMRPPIGPLAWLGSGRQPLPWVHVDDVVGMIQTVLADDRWRGPVNAVAPEGVDHRTFVRQLARVAERPVMPVGVAGFLLRIALGELATMLLAGAPVRPLVAQDLDYPWRQPRLAEALRECQDAERSRTDRAG